MVYRVEAAPVPRWRKVLISLFVLFHLGCVAAWLLPPSALRYFLLSDGIASDYLHHTAQWQDWSMFAPDPLQANRHVGATVTFRDGRREEVVFPRLSQMNFLEAWIEKRWRKYQQQIIEQNAKLCRQDLARYIARRKRDPSNPPIRVAIYKYEALIPRHDRAELREPHGWIDYTRLLRDEGGYSRVTLEDYPVKPEDLR